MTTSMTVLIIALVAALLILFLRWSDKSITAAEYIIDDDRIGWDFNEMRILQVSDLQNCLFGPYQIRLCRAAQKLHPDIIVITGDFLDRRHTNYMAADNAMAYLSAIAPVFYADGNHERLLNEEDYNDFCCRWASTGNVTFLFNEAAEVIKKKSRMIIGGLSEETVNQSRGYNRKATTWDHQAVIDEVAGLFVEQRDQEISFSAPPFRVLLAHEPQLLDDYVAGGAQLIFSGHAHGGQIRLPGTQGLYAPEQGWMPKLTSGVHRKEESRMVISRGLGNSRFPFRLFNRPELVLVRLRASKPGGKGWRKLFGENE